ncbi:MAG: molybdate ABC transporter substrate-binding protein [bacterium]|nr:molybdate ABC transporter substrate-binding protein [bacterium]
MALFLAASGYAAPASRSWLTVYAASSLQGALPEIGALHERATGVRTEFVFASSGALARKISAGGPADLYVSAHREWTAFLEKKGTIVPGSLRPIARNTLVCVLPRGEMSPVAGPADLLRIPRIAIGDPAHVPAGRYAVSALRAAGLWTRLEKTGKIVFARDVRSALAFAERGAVSAAIVYATDARASRKVRIAFVFPESSHPPIAYYAARVAGSRNGKDAAVFFRFLSQDDAKAVFRKRGFLVPSSMQVKP